MRCFLLAACCAGLAQAVRADATHHVLVLYSNGRLLPANVEFDQAFSEGLGAQAGLQAQVSAEFLDSPRFSGEDYGSAVAAYLDRKYAAQAPEVIVAGGDAALDFVLRHRAQLLPGVPVLYMAASIDHIRSLPALPSDVIGVPIKYDFLGTVEQALRWHPKARHLVVVTGSDPWSRGWEARVRSDAAALDGRVSIEFLAGLPSAELQARLRDLRDDAVVFTPGYFLDGEGRRFVPRDSALLIAAASAAPVYGPLPSFMGTGVVGGHMMSFSEMGRLAAQATAQLLAGAAPASVALPTTFPIAMHLDWGQARRWGIAEDAVPPETVVQFREPTFWESHRELVLVVVSVMLVQAALIAALLFERGRRRRVAAALAQSEQRMSLAARAARMSMWIWDTGRPQAWVRSPSRRRSDVAADQLTDFRNALEGIDPQDRGIVEQAVKEALATGEELEVQYRVTGADGEQRWMTARGRADGGNRQRLLGVAVDITQRKRTELQAEQDRAALRHMTRVSTLGQLSASIAHQLNQPLASILANAEAAQKMLARDTVDLPELREICNDIVAEDHRAGDVIRRLSALFRRGEPLLVAVDVNTLVHDTLDLVRTDLLTQRIGIVMELAPALPPVEGDRVQLQQLLLNLVTNAADAMREMPEASREVTISTELRGAEVNLCVADRGPGFREDDQVKLFDPFWSTKSEGLGIGLAICRSIAMAHHGSLTAHNAPERGAVFCLALPARAKP